MSLSTDDRTADRDPRHPPSPPPALGLVLGAGGAAGSAFHAGVVAALAEVAGLDPRSADVMVGTSAGANTAASLRGGLSAEDHLARFTGEPLSDEGRELADRLSATQAQTGAHAGSLGGEPSRWPLSIRMALSSLSPRRGLRPGLALAGARPAGLASTAGLAAHAQSLHPSGWPVEPTWICAVRATDGRRVVFGRDDLTGSIGDAVAASSAVPGESAPVAIAGVRYLDGAVHSPTNADLVAPLALSAVVISSPMSASRGAGSWSVVGVKRAWHTRQLDMELNLHPRSVAVLRLEPDTNALGAMARSATDPGRPAAIARAAFELTVTELGSRRGQSFVASATPSTTH